MVKIELNRVAGDYGFEATNENGKSVYTDGSPEIGGQNFGVRPMQLLLAGLGSCSAIDIISILKKQRQVIEGFKIIVAGEREAGKEPSLWKKVQVQFELTGTIDAEKARRACELSVEKYCSVAETLRRAGATIEWNVKINEHEYSSM